MRIRYLRYFALLSLVIMDTFFYFERQANIPLFVMAIIIISSNFMCFLLWRIFIMWYGDRYPDLADLDTRERLR